MTRKVVTKMGEGVITSKRKQIDKTQAKLYGIVMAAAIVSVFALVAAKSFFGQASYYNKVNGIKEKAVKQLKENQDAVSSLVKSYQSFASQNPNLIGGNATGKTGRDGDNGRLVLDALPSKYDFPALATSLEKMLNGFTINSISGSDDSTIQDQAGAAKLVEMPFIVNVSTDYNGAQRLLSSLEKSIRPFQVDKMAFSGTNGSLKIEIKAKTFFQPEKMVKIDSKVVK